ncbi:MAG: methyltransferase domain-containing protein [Acidobacteriota bacterium]
MTVVLVTEGSRGDLEPFVALGEALGARGHRVRIVTSKTLASWVRSETIETVAFDTELAPPDDDHADLTDPRRTILRLPRLIRAFDHLSRALEARQHELLRACGDAELLVTTPIGLGAPHIADALELPYVWASPWPMHPSRAWAFPLAPPWTYDVSLLRRLSHRITARIAWRVTSGVTKRLRATLGLPPIDRRELGRRLAEQPTLYGYSHNLLPVPAEWPPHRHVTGAWLDPGFDHTNAEIEPPELARWLDEGDTPILFSLGGLDDGDRHQIATLLPALLDRLDRRAVVLGGHDSLPASTHEDPRILAFDYVRYVELLPRVRTMVSHAGAGTVTQALRAGVPVLAVPQVVDQHFWGWALEGRGVGCRARRLDLDTLCRQLRALESPEVRQRVDELATAIRGEDGTARAVELIEDRLERQRHGHTTTRVAVAGYYRREMSAYLDHVGPTWQGGLLRHADDNGEPTATASNVRIAERAELRGGRWLDAGCGVGGPALDIAASRPEVRIVGITLGVDQAREAHRRARDRGLDERVSFVAGDYLQLPFPDRSFDGVYFLESCGHAADLRRLFAEAFRVLVTGGRLYVKGVYRPDRPLTATERRQFDRFDELYAYRSRSMAMNRHAVEAAGFEAIEVHRLGGEDQVSSAHFLNAFVEADGTLSAFGEHHHDPELTLAPVYGEIRARKPTVNPNDR